MMLRKCLMPNSSGKLTFKDTHTHRHTHTSALSLVSFRDTDTRGYIGAFSSAQVFLLALFSDPHPSVPYTFHPGRVLPSLSGDKNLIKLTCTQGHTLKHTLHLLRVPLTELTISVKPSNKTHLNLLGLFPSS